MDDARVHQRASPEVLVAAGPVIPRGGLDVLSQGQKVIHGQPVHLVGSHLEGSTGRARRPGPDGPGPCGHAVVGEVRKVASGVVGVGHADLGPQLVAGDDAIPDERPVPLGRGRDDGRPVAVIRCEVGPDAGIVHGRGDPVGGVGGRVEPNVLAGQDDLVLQGHGGHALGVGDASGDNDRRAGSRRGGRVGHLPDGRRGVAHARAIGAPGRGAHPGLRSPQHEAAVEEGVGAGSEVGIGDLDGEDVARCPKEARPQGEWHRDEVVVLARPGRHAIERDLVDVHRVEVEQLPVEPHLQPVVVKHLGLHGSELPGRRHVEGPAQVKRGVVASHVVEPRASGRGGTEDIRVISHRGGADLPRGVVEARQPPCTRGGRGLGPSLPDGPRRSGRRHRDLGHARDRLDGCTPVAAQRVVEGRVDELDRVPRRVPHRGPWESQAVIHPVHLQRRGIAQDQGLAFPRKTAGPRPQGLGHPKFGPQRRRVRRHDHEAPCRHRGARRESILQRSRELPSSQGHLRRPVVVELHELHPLLLHVGRVMDLMDDHGRASAPCQRGRQEQGKGLGEARCRATAKPERFSWEGSDCASRSSKHDRSN